MCEKYVVFRDEALKVTLGMRHLEGNRKLHKDAVVILITRNVCDKIYYECGRKYTVFLYRPHAIIVN